MKHFYKILIATTFTSLIAAASMAQNPNAEYEENWNEYRVVAVKNNDNTVKSYSNAIEVAKPMSIYAPNAFSPDNDGINDYFFVSGEGIEEFSLEVYNRWGELVFASNEQDIHWDGTYEGVEAPIGAYVYQVSGRSTDGSEHVLKSGSVALVR